MNRNLEKDYLAAAPGDVETRFLSNSLIEIVGDHRTATIPKHALFDFDGTLSLIREGWPDVMIPMMVEILQRTGTDETAEQLAALTTEFVTELTGKQTIYQMIRLAAEVERRAAPPLAPDEYKRQYHDRLLQRIEVRREGLRVGSISPQEMLVPGSLDLLELLRARGVSLYLASGTDEHYVREELELLGIEEYFGDHVYGAVDDYTSFSKAGVIKRIMDVNQVDGRALLGFGDGYVEIQNVCEAGGTAVAVASDEAGRSGKPDAWKRERLIGAGAHLVVPDYVEADRLVAYLFDVAE